MSRSANTREAPAGSDRRTANAYDDIEDEFLGIWLGLARLRERIRQLATREPAPAPQRPV